MKRSNEFAVGAVTILAILLVIAGAIALGQVRLGGPAEIQVARFRSVGGLGPGANVYLRGVKVGRVAAIRVAEDDWVEAELRLERDLKLPARPAAIAAPATLFGEWRVNILAIEEAPSDQVQRELGEAAAAGGNVWPGTTLPDIGEITLQASRIAGDIGTITNRVGGALDSTAVAEVRASLRDLRTTVLRLTEMANQQSENFAKMSGNLTRASGEVDVGSRRFNTIMGRVDSATANGQLQLLVNETRQASAALRDLTADMQAIVSDVRDHRRSLIRVLESSDSLLTRVQEGRGTLSLLARDSTLYHEATGAIRQLRGLLADIQANPRRYFRFSVF
jgi:phospholipid/cholesterol/gamma-HCH transport system substrate-binding protein